VHSEDALLVARAAAAVPARPSARAARQWRESAETLRAMVGAMPAARAALAPELFWAGAALLHAPRAGVYGAAAAMLAELLGCVDLGDACTQVSGLPLHPAAPPPPRAPRRPRA